MAEKYPPQILRGSYESDYTSVGWTSPRISFSRDFAQVDQEGMPIQVEDRKHYSSDFEFAMADLCNPPGSVPSGAMLSADELISDGKLLPFEQSRFPIPSGRHSVSSSTTPFPDPQASSSSAPSLKASRSYPSSRGEVTPPISPKAPRCGATWRELFRFKTKHCQREKENVLSEKEERASSKLFRLFSRSRSVGSEEIDRLSYPARSLLIAQANAHPFPADKIFTDSSNLENSSPAINHVDALSNTESYAGSPARLWIRTGGKHTEHGSRSKIKSTCTSPGKIVPLRKHKEGGLGRKHVLRSSSFARDGDKGSAARIAMRNLEKYPSSSRSNENKRIHGNPRTDRWGEYWRAADNTVSHSKVRVAPVLLNVPACMAPSLRGVNVSKTKLVNLRHLFPLKKVERPKNF